MRKGPGVEYATVGKMTKDSSAVIVGKNQDGKWLQLAYPNKENPGWVSVAFVDVKGSLDNLQVVAITPAPTATRGTVVAVGKATPTQAVPPARGGIGAIYYENESNSFIVGTLSVETHVLSGFKKLGAKPGSFDIEFATNMPPFAWSPDGTQLAFVFFHGGAEDFLRISNRNGDEKSLYSHSCVSSPNWQDNKTVVYIGMDGNDCTDQAIYKLDTTPGGVRENFFKARSGESLRGLAWGKWVLFVSNLTGQQEIWKMNQDASGAIQLTSDKRENSAPSWNPDYSKIAYQSKQADGSFQIFVMNADGTGARALTRTNNNLTPTWSPDGNWIAFTSDRGGRYDIYIMDKNGGNLQLLTDKGAVGGRLPGSWR